VLYARDFLLLLLVALILKPHTCRTLSTVLQLNHMLVISLNL
jgi:hypothetical protein